MLAFLVCKSVLGIPRGSVIEKKNGFPFPLVIFETYCMRCAHKSRVLGIFLFQTLSLQLTLRVLKCLETMYRCFLGQLWTSFFMR
jgi:hypothetical protein